MLKLGLGDSREELYLKGKPNAGYDSPTQVDHIKISKAKDHTCVCMTSTADVRYYSITPVCLQYIWRVNRGMLECGQVLSDLHYEKQQRLGCPFLNLNKTSVKSLTQVPSTIPILIIGGKQAM
ncbi:hypothetical protein D5086_009000 [Populus alba]|uniref:Uncharacterized protein n=1 Tax=Populus alba TaxID=43335 RepID=A0ACC4CJG8_POPAL